MSKLADQPAFPRQGAIHNKAEYGGQSGMTLRQHYAGEAMNGMLANPTLCLKPIIEEMTKACGEHWLQIIAIGHADALLAELERKTEE
jgi:hypothetical protein